MGILLTKMDVAQDHVGDVLVSTLCFGLGAAYGEPVYWETAVVSGGEDAHPDLWDRYESREAAVAGHARVLAAVIGREAAAWHVRYAEAERGEVTEP